MLKTEGEPQSHPALQCHWITGLSPLSDEPFISAGILVFTYTVTPNDHHCTKLPSFLLVDDLSPTAQRKLRLEAGTPLTSCS